MKNILYIKDWLAQKDSHRQFKVLFSVINGNHTTDNTITRVQRINDGLKFCLGICTANKAFSIDKFHDDGIHITFRNVINNHTILHKINALEPIWAYYYGIKTGQVS